MAFNMKEGPKAPLGVNYEKHLSKPIVGSSSTSKKHASQTEASVQGISESETLHPGVFSNASITVAGGRTINLGNFESARVDVSVTVPFMMEKYIQTDALDEAYDFATEWVSQKIEEAVKAAKGTD